MSNNKSLKEFKLNIGGFIISVTSQIGKQGFEFIEGFKHFFSRKRDADIRLRVQFGLPLKYKLGKTVFCIEKHGRGAWSLHRYNGKYIFHFAAFSPDCNPYNLAVLDPDFRSGDIYINVKKENQKIWEGKEKIRFPLREPLGELLMVSFLSLGRGLLVHSCGVRDNGKGILFAGSSGTGKSTIGNIWKRRKSVSVLSDDMVVIRKRNGRLWIYGTPWRGEAKLASSEGVPLDKIFFIKHAKKNTMTKMSPVEAIPWIITRSFPTLWDKKGMKFTLKFCDELARKIPCYKLGFVPNKSVLDFAESNR